MRAVLQAQINKTDRNDARGIAQIMRAGLYRPVHVKTLRSQKSAGTLNTMVLAQSLGDADRQAPRHEKSHRGAGTPLGRDHAPHIRSNVLFSRPNIERAHEQAKALRSQFFRENHKLMVRGLLGAVVVCALAVMVAGRPASQRALEGTVFMEQLTTTLTHAKIIAPDTVREISQLLQKPDYDCNQLACDANLQKRNRVARDHLKSVLNRPTRSNELADSTNARLNEVDHASTASAVVTQRQSVR